MTEICHFYRLVHGHDRNPTQIETSLRRPHFSETFGHSKTSRNPIEIESIFATPFCIALLRHFWPFENESKSNRNRVKFTPPHFAMHF